MIKSPRLLFLAPFRPANIGEPGCPRLVQFAKHLSSNHGNYLAVVAEGHEEIGKISRFFDRIHCFPETQPRISLHRRLQHSALGRPYFDESLRRPKYFRSLVEWTQRICDENKIDIVVGRGTETALIAAELKVKVRVMDLVDSLPLLFRRQAEAAAGKIERLRLLREVRSIERLHKKILPKMDLNVFISEVDEADVQDHAGVRNTVVVPNGVDAEYFSPKDGADKQPTAVFFGVLNYQPNTDAAIYLAREIFPFVQARLPSARLEIVGAQPPAEVTALSSLAGVTVRADVPDIRDYLTRGRVMACPLRFGAGMKNKLLNALAMEMPVVASSLSTDGLIEDGGPGVLRVDEPKVFAEKLAGLLENQKTVQELGVLGRSYVLQNYSWERSSQLLDRQLCELLARKE